MTRKEVVPKVYRIVRVTDKLPKSRREALEEAKKELGRFPGTVLVFKCVGVVTSSTITTVTMESDDDDT